MFQDVLAFFKDRLSDALGFSDAEPEKIGFPNFTNTQSIEFANNCLTLLLVNFEQERVMRSPDRFIRRGTDNEPLAVEPDLHLNLYILIVANYTDYLTSLTHLSEVTQYFLENHVFSREKTSNFPEALDRLSVELVTLPFSEQNDLWNLLKVPYRPSVLYRIQLLVFRDAEPQSLPKWKLQTVPKHKKDDDQNT